jgi:hypothetical protein
VGGMLLQLINLKKKKDNYSRRYEVISMGITTVFL